MTGRPQKAEEELITVLVLVCAGAAALSSAGLLWAKGGVWAVRHKLVVGRVDDPLLVLPGLHGAGLDWPRIALLLALLLMAAALTAGAIRERRKRALDQLRADRGIGGRR